VASDYLFRPLAHPVVLALLPLRVPPPAVVVVHALMGLAAAGLILADEFVAAAVLLLAKTVLDAVDGQLARASGRVTPLGRYLDTELDTLANVAIFAALGAATGKPWLAAAAFVSLTLTLSADYVLGSGGRDAEPTARGDDGNVLRIARRVYGLVFLPQDRAIARLDRSRFEASVGDGADQAARDRAAVAYADPVLLTVLANLGLATQFLVLAVCLIVGVPEVYLWLALAGGTLLPFLQLRRERRARRAAVATPGAAATAA